MLYYIKYDAGPVCDARGGRHLPRSRGPAARGVVHAVTRPRIMLVINEYIDNNNNNNNNNNDHASYYYYYCLVL